MYYRIGKLIVRVSFQDPQEAKLWCNKCDWVEKARHRDAEKRAADHMRRKHHVEF